MTNEETIKELSDALEATTKERLSSEKDNLQRTIFIYDRLKFIRNQLTVITIVLAIIALISLCSCSQEENIYDKQIRLNNIEKAKSQAKLDSIDLELIKLGVDGSTKGK